MSLEVGKIHFLFLESAAQLWSAKTRGLIEFDTIAPMTIDRVRVERVARQVAQEGRGGVKRKR